MPEKEIATDDELVAAYEGGDEGAFAALTERYLPAVYAFAFRLVGGKEAAEDVAQETFVKAWKNLKRFKKGAKMKTWLFSIARNTAIDDLRKKRPKLFGELGGNDDRSEFEQRLPDDAPDAEIRFDESIATEALEEALAKLAPMYREIILLHYHESLTLQEVAETLGIPVNTVKSRDRRALAALRKLLEPAKES